LLYGADATLELMENEPHGFIARVVLPIDRATSRHAADAAALEQALVP
jgi:hypothetical protein